MAERTKGKCKYCGKPYTASYMGRHLAVCEARRQHLEERNRPEGKEQVGYFLLKVYGTYNKQYWMYIEADEDLTLSDLDQFLRDIWLECCGHLSMFTIHGMEIPKVAFEDFGDDPENEMSNIRLGDVLQPDLQFHYEYDFGSTTDLELYVEGYREGAPEEEPITILSRNIAPKILCDHCHKEEATMVRGWYDPSGTFLCDDCAEDLEVNEDEFLLVCNSPRIGVCAYEGSYLYPEEFVPDTELTE